MNYDQYTIRISDDPTYYGSDCTQADAARIVRNLATMIRAEYPGIGVETHNETDRSATILGPDDEVCDQIERWVDDNWTAAY